ncbi:family 43 glycosylhydrolase [Xylanibacter muris]|uniref:Family 43 glycosylhydrolase n=1 Tax=Xylanibacter muris TaxID=2736290 RepID=A0ABX2ANG5_9BACT|nr:family 43 glycosylhydrolase [Xylanibacter muris]NPD92488.1 family 43 glycosylhydrolase [Xylanibacter muris]
MSIKKIFCDKQTYRLKTVLVQAALIFITSYTGATGTGTTSGEFGTIHNDTFWNTSDGQPLYSHGGGIFKFTDPDTGQKRYYWYGVRYKGSVEYRTDPAVTVEHAVFDGVTCYSSDNLTDWKYEGDVLTRNEIALHERVSWVGRLGVAFIPEKQKYALIVQCGSGVLFTTCDTPNGQFRWFWKKDMTSTIGTPNTGDQTVFTDEDTNRSYLIYSYGRGRNKIYISEIGIKNDTIDLIDCQQIFKGESREGNCMFKYKGKYYMCASNIYGWDGSYAYYLMADNIKGPYTPVNNMQVMSGCENDYAHVSQTGFFYTVRGTKEETVIYCGDRWSCFAGNGIGYNQWVPLSFDRNGKPVFNSVSSWSLNAKTGEWKINKDNNYVLNGSFEADRRRIPNPVKPRQEFLLGWKTEFIEGRKTSVEDSLSPRLNYFNTQSDRKFVIGEKSLCITDTEPFKRRVSQTITSSSTLPLPDGKYTLSAKACRTGSFDKLIMYARSNGKTKIYRIKTKSGNWEKIKMQDITVSGGQIEIGFEAKGQGGAQCLIDDVELIMRH